jgi:ATP-dependent helicase/DNAse subunit B
MTHVTAFVGSTRRFRNNFIFETALNTHQAPKIDFFYLVETPRRAQQLEELYLGNFPAVFEMPIATLPQFLHLIRRESGNNRVISNSEKILLIEELLGLPENPFAPAEKIPGLAQRLSTFIADIKNQTILDEKLLELHWAKKGAPPLATQLSWIFTKYQQLLLNSQLEDAEGLQANLYQRLMTGQILIKNIFPQLERIYLEGFSKISPLQHALLRQVREQVGEMIISCDLEPKENSQTDGAFREMLEFLENVDDFKKTSYPNPPIQSALRLPNRDDEVRWVVSEIKQITDHTEDTQIGIITSQLERYRLRLESALRELGVEEWEFLAEPPTLQPEVALFLDYLKLVELSFPRQALFDFLHHPWIHCGLSPENLKLLERWAVITRVEKGLEVWTKEFPEMVQNFANQAKDSKGPLSSSQIEKLLRDFKNLLLKIDLPSTDQKCHDWLNTAAASLQNFFSPGSDGNNQNLDNWTNALPRFLQSVSRVGEWKVGVISLHEFSNICRHHIPARKPRGTVSNISIGSPDDLEHLSLDYIFWVGLTEEEFPITRIRPSFISTLPYTEEFRKSNSTAQISTRTRRFQWISSQAGHKVTYTLPEWDRGTPALASSLLEKMEIGQADPPQVSPLPLPGTLDNIRRGTEVLKQLEFDVHSRHAGFLRSPNSIEEFRRDFLDKGLHLSPTQLESYANCGFQFFGEQVLGIDGEPEEGEITPRGLGKLLHRTLSKFMAEIEVPPQGDKSQWLRTQNGRMLGILEKEVAALVIQEPFRTELEWTICEKFLKQGLQRSPDNGLLSNFIREQSSWLREQRVIDLEKQLRPMQIGTVHPQDAPAGIPFFLNGTVDRVDSNQNGLIVIDYKTGQAPLKKLYDGLGFQLPLYSLLVENHYRADVGSRFFLQLSLPSDVWKRNIRVASEDLEKIWSLLIDYYKKLSLEAAEHILSGHFPITTLPPRLAGCPTCKLRDICRYTSEKADRLRASDKVLLSQALVRSGDWVGPESEDLKYR